VLPSIWKDQIAFARVYERRSGNRGIYPYLYVRPLAGGRSDRQPGGSRGETGLPGPTSLDLYGRRLSFVWNHSRRGRRGVSAVRLDTIGGGHRVLSKEDFRLEFGYATYLSPTGSRGRIYYGFQRIFGLLRGARPAKPTTDLLLRYRISTADKALADAPPFLVSTPTDGGVTFFGRASDGEKYFTPLGEVLRKDTGPFRD